MEQLLHYVWKHKLFPLNPLTTTDHRQVEVIDVGLQNRNSGPDFFNAKVKIDGTLWVGNVEIHERSSQWNTHKHHLDAAYNNVILHVVGCADTEIRTQKGDVLPQMELPIPPKVHENYEELVKSDAYPPCHKIIPALPKLMIHSWMSALLTERLEQKTNAIQQRALQLGNDWEAAYFVTLARSFGFGINGEAFEQWAMNLRLAFIAHHRDNRLQVEAYFMGMAGLLNPLSIPERYRNEAMEGDYYQQLCREFEYLCTKFKGALPPDEKLEPMDFKSWRFLRLRPQNFPYIRIAQLADLYCSRKMSLSAIADCENIKQLKELLTLSVSDFWRNHYTFAPSKEKENSDSIEKNAHHLSAKSAELVIINAIIPMLFAYGRHKNNEQMVDKAFRFLDALRAENNHIVRMWRDTGLQIATAGDAQALIELKNCYCDDKQCLRCRIGFEYLKQTKDKENDTKQVCF